MKKPAILIAVLVGIFGAAQQDLRAATTYSVTENISCFGWLDQYSLDSATYNNVGPQACVPTASTNAMTYLQKLAPGYFGTALTGTTYTSWMAADATLVSAGYMDTDPASGTYYNHIPYALNKYIIGDKGFSSVQFSGMFENSQWADAPYDKPSYITEGTPTTQFLLTALRANNAILFSIKYDGSGGGTNSLPGGSIGRISTTTRSSRNPKMPPSISLILSIPRRRIPTASPAEGRNSPKATSGTAAISPPASSNSTTASMEANFPTATTTRRPTP